MHAQTCPQFWQICVKQFSIYVCVCELYVKIIGPKIKQIVDPSWAHYKSIITDRFRENSTSKSKKYAMENRFGNWDKAKPDCI